MRNLRFIIFLCFLSLGVSAQTIREEITSDPRCSASNYMAYPTPKGTLTPAPNGKKPFYISHYGRHGSRHIINHRDYDYPYFTLLRADSMGKLNDKGREVVQRLKRLRDNAEKRHGELTQLGHEQHMDIARRMYERFPEVFKGDVCIDAKSTQVVRCILSMASALRQLTIMNPRLRINFDASEHDMYYMNFRDNALRANRMPARSKELYNDFCMRHQPPFRPVECLFNDTAYARHIVNLERLNYYLFKNASIVQNTDLRDSLNFYDLYTDEELYLNWLKDNVYWYLTYGPSPHNGGTQPYSQRNLLRKIIEQADSCIALERPGANLRFGHETMVLPLVCLMGINGYDAQIEDMEQLVEKGWVNYHIFPMGANVQLIFYRKNAKDKDVLVKVLLNEEEAALPLKTDCAPYYHWSDFREYYLDKINTYEAQH